MKLQNSRVAIPKQPHWAPSPAERGEAAFQALIYSIRIGERHL